VASARERTPRWRWHRVSGQADCDSPPPAPSRAATGLRSIDAFVTTEVESTPLIDRISEDVYRAIRAGAQAALAPFTTSAGSVEAPLACNVIVARR
jgi:hypothetical protein